MIITRTPFRISFLGGGSDYPQWYNSHMGMVLGATIDKYCYITYQPNQEKFRILYSQLEEVDSIDSISHPAVKACLEYMNMTTPAGIFHASDLPARSGMGSSSAFVVGLLNALIQEDYLSNMELANAAIEIEQNILHEPVGSQDQLLTAYGGINQIVFHPTGSKAIRPLRLNMTVGRIEEFHSHLMLFYTGPRTNIPPTPLTFDVDITRRLATMAKEGADILTSGDIIDFGTLLDEGWQLKKQMSPSISNYEIDRIYSEAMLAGAIGGKILGSGGGGFMLLFAEPVHQIAVEWRVGLKRVPFQFEFEGSKVIYNANSEQVQSPLPV